MADEEILQIAGFNINGQNEDDSDDSDSDSNNDDHEVELIRMLRGEDDDEEDEVDGENNEIDEEYSNATMPDINFDPSLPATHSYLGTDLEEVSGRTIHDDDSCQQLPLLALPSVVLCPGQTLPLQLHDNASVAMIRRVAASEEDRTFGLVTVTTRYQSNIFSSIVAPIGTTAEILAFKEENDDGSGISMMRVKAIGRQRFEIVEKRRQIDGILMGKVRILPEKVLPNPLDGAIPPSHRKFMVESEEPTDNGNIEGGDTLQILHNCLNQYHNKKVYRKYNKLSSANLTWWPPWVYRQYDVKHVMELVMKELSSWNETLRRENMPQDPVHFSYWVAGNLPLDDRLKLYLLRIDSAVQRLRCELSIMQKCTVLSCKNCDLLIADKNDVFSLSLQGPMAAFVNPGGYVHETLTIYKAQGISLVGGPSTENSWFPGYAWTIANCRNCRHHLGWKFTAAQKGLQPEKFWGLTRSALLPGLQADDEETAEHWVPTM